MTRMVFASLLVLVGCVHHVPTPSVSRSTPVPCQEPTNSSARGDFHIPVFGSRENMRRIDSLGSLVDTLVLQPESLTLRVGQSVDFDRVVTIERRRKSGEAVATSPTWNAVEDLSVVQFRDAGLTGIRVGRTRVVVTVFSDTPELPAHAPPSCLVVRVTP